jgi:hypothetical protein
MHLFLRAHHKLHVDFGCVCVDQSNETGDYLPFALALYTEAAKEALHVIRGAPQRQDGGTHGRRFNSARCHKTKQDYFFLKAF